MQFNDQQLDLPVIEQIIDPTPLKVSPQTPIIDVIALMGEVRHRSCELITSNLTSSSLSGYCERVDCALIMEGEELKGIFTEQDLVRVAAMDINLSETPIARVMTQKLITLTYCKTHNIFTVLSLLRKHKIRHLPIVNDQGELLGLVSASLIRQVLQPSHLLKLWRVSEVMVKQVIHAPKTAPVLKLAQLMANLRISCVVIVESDHDSCLKPVGIITERDIVQFKFLELNLGQIEAQAVMSHPLFCLKPSDSLWLAQQEMQHRHVRRLVVTGEQGELQGIVTQSSFLQVFDPVELSSMIAILQGVVAQKTSELAQTNEELKQEINQRLQVETQLRQAQEQLEKRVEDRTAELSRTNQRLQQEINERQQIEEKIREQAELLNITTDAICVYNLCDQIIFCNQGAERLYDWTREEVLGKNTPELFKGETCAELSKALTTVLEKGEWQGELTKSTQKEKTVIVASRWTLIRDERGQSKSILVVDTDITEKKQLEAQVLRSQRLESLGRLASGIAHDFNNILTPILGASQLLPVLSYQEDESIQKLLKSIENNAKRGTELIKQLLSFARGIEVQKTPISLVQLFSELETTLKSVFPKSIEIIIDSDSSNLWTVLADPTQLYQVFLNICINGRDAMPNGGLLSIRGKNFYLDESYQKMYLEACVGPYIVVTFSDTGVGMTPEIQEQIFDPFFTTKAVGKGTGLGLATVMGIVKNHGGFVTVSSQVNKGTQFQVFLPAMDVEKTASLADLKDLKGQKELILVVDDDAPIQDITRKTLEVYNYQVITAKDGIEAIALYVQYKEKIQAVLMDLIMPTMDGFSAIRALQKLNPQVKVIAISGLESYSHSLNKDGIKTFLSKPYTTQELLRTLRLILDSTYNTIN